MHQSPGWLYQSLWASLILCFTINSTPAQTTTFTYQGKLTDNALPANANYDFEFRLFSVDTGGIALGTLQRLNTAVATGIFTVQLDFGGQFGGSDRWLEIAVKPAGSPDPFTTLNPRQPITSVPYAMRSMSAANATNALMLGGVAANQYVLTTDARLTDARSPLPGSVNYIQNTISPQASSNFNISGNGTAGGTLTANIIDATTQYNIGGSRVLSVSGAANTFAGRVAGFNNTIGTNNAFFGNNAGQENTMGSKNSFFGSRVAEANTTGEDNAFFGFAAGINNLDANRNSFFGSESGEFNKSGDDNAFFGYQAGLKNLVNGNSFFGSNAGRDNTSGINNSFFGRNAGNNQTTGNGNSFFGSSTGGSNTTGSANSFFGSSAGSSSSTGGSNSFFGNAAGNSNTSGSNNTVIGAGADVSIGNLSFATAIGAQAVVSSSNTIVLGRSAGEDDVRVPGSIAVLQLGSAGSTSICRNGSNFLATCSSSLRYKTSVEPFTGGLEVVEKLRPIRFVWKQSRIADIGFAAEEVEQVEPLLVTYNDKGEIEGVKYSQLSTVLVNAVKELKRDNEH
jgi:hypothetical protein